MEAEQAQLQLRRVTDTHKPQARETEAVAPGKTTKDQVDLSPEAERLGNVRQAVEKAPDVREDVVAHFKQLVTSGAYEIDSRDLARRILDVLA